MKHIKKGFVFFIVAAWVVSVLLWFVQDKDVVINQHWERVVRQLGEKREVDLNEFIKLYKDGYFDKIKLQDSVDLRWYVFMTGSQEVTSMAFNQALEVEKYNRIETKKPADSSMTDLGFDFMGDTPIKVDYTQRSTLASMFLEHILPLVFFVFILAFVFKLMRGKSGGMPFGSSAGKLADREVVDTTFDDVAGLKEVKDEVWEIVDFLKNPKKYQKAWADIPKWVLLYGAPWVGKTLIARAVAGQAQVPFFSVSGSEFMEMLVGMGASKVRNLFKKAKAASPAIIFIDEIDSIGKKRWQGMSGGHQEQQQTLNQILTEMDGFDNKTKVIVMGATNRPDVLDKALLRSGRFDRKIRIWNPTLEERKAILDLHLENKEITDDVDLDSICKRTSGFVWADLKNLANEAALKAAKEDRHIINRKDFDYALEKIVMWPEKKMKSMKEKERKIIAFHELGHAIPAYYLEHADPVEKISIVSRWRALGVTWMLPEEETHLTSKEKFLDKLVSLLGGRAAEEIFFGKESITTWGANDIQNVTDIAKKMVLKYGMDEDLGTILYLDEDKEQYKPFKPFSEKTADLIDNKVKQIADKAYERAMDIIKENKKRMASMAEVLLTKEYLTKEEFNKLMETDNIKDLVEEMTKDYNDWQDEEKWQEEKTSE